MRLCGSSVGFVLSLLLSFLSGGLLFLYWRANSNLEQFEAENRQLRKELLNANNDRKSGLFKLSLARGDLEDANKAKRQMEDDVIVKHTEFYRLQHKFNSTLQELQTLKYDNEQNQLEISNLRVNKEAMYKQLDVIQAKLKRCGDAREKAKQELLQQSTVRPMVHVEPAGHSVYDNDRHAGVLKPDDTIDGHKLVNPYNSVKHQQQQQQHRIQQRHNPSKQASSLTDHHSLTDHRSLHDHRQDQKPHVIYRDKPQSIDPQGMNHQNAGMFNQTTRRVNSRRTQPNKSLQTGQQPKVQTKQLEF